MARNCYTMVIRSDLGDGYQPSLSPHVHVPWSLIDRGRRSQVPTPRSPLPWPPGGRWVSHVLCPRVLRSFSSEDPPERSSVSFYQKEMIGLRRVLAELEFWYLGCFGSWDFVE